MKMLAAALVVVAAMLGLLATHAAPAGPMVLFENPPGNFCLNAAQMTPAFGPNRFYKTCAPVSSGTFTTASGIALRVTVPPQTNMTVQSIRFFGYSESNANFWTVLPRLRVMLGGPSLPSATVTFSFSNETLVGPNGGLGMQQSTDGSVCSVGLVQTSTFKLLVATPVYPFTVSNPTASSSYWWFALDSLITAGSKVTTILCRNGASQVMLPAAIRCDTGPNVDCPASCDTDFAYCNVNNTGVCNGLNVPFRDAGWIDVSNFIGAPNTCDPVYQVYGTSVSLSSSSTSGGSGPSPSTTSGLTPVPSTSGGGGGSSASSSTSGAGGAGGASTSTNSPASVVLPDLINFI